MRPKHHRHLLLAVLVALLPAIAAPAAPSADDTERDRSLERARELLDGGEAQAALAIVDPLLDRDPDDAEALLLRSTAHFLLGEREAGRRDLRRAVELDPELRQAWLNLAALAIADGELDAALEALERARDLDPDAADNGLNLGAVHILRGELTAASESFGRYLDAHPDSADATYLVAANYALGGFAALAVEHLERAVALDEKTRLRARTDPRFSDLADDPRFVRLLATDAYRPPPGAHRRRAAFAAGYRGGEGPLLGAVIDAARDTSRALDPRVEVTAGWALVWGDLRIKVEDGEEGGVVSVSAPAESLTPGEFRRATDRLFAAIAGRLGAS